MENKVNIIDDADAFDVAYCYGRWVELELDDITFAQYFYSKNLTTTCAFKNMFIRTYSVHRIRYNKSQTNNHLVEFDKLKNLDKLYKGIELMARHVIYANEH